MTACGPAGISLSLRVRTSDPIIRISITIHEIMTVSVMGISMLNNEKVNIVFMSSASIRPIRSLKFCINYTPIGEFSQVGKQGLPCGQLVVIIYAENEKTLYTKGIYSH
jgi:hypothetical protein